MTDLEITKACAEAMGLNYVDGFIVHGQLGEPYVPLKDDAQAMALVKKFGLAVWGSNHAAGEWEWHAESQVDPADEGYAIGHGNDLNRAICECVSRISKEPKP